MLRLTALKNQRIWFSYDFVTKDVLDREKTLDDSMWNNTLNLFQKKYNKYPSRKGFATLH
jgi:hypothetical protein